MPRTREGVAVDEVMEKERLGSVVVVVDVGVSVSVGVLVDVLVVVVADWTE